MRNSNQVKGTGRVSSKLRILLGSLFMTLCMLAVGGLTILQKDVAGVVEALAHSPAHGKIVVANRAEGTISLIDTKTDAVIDTVPLPDPLPEDAMLPQPMYVVSMPSHHRVFVGDRTYNQVVVFAAHDFRVEGTIPAGNGVFHMDRRKQQLWVNNDIDKTITVIDTHTLELLTTIPVPQDLVDAGGIPHDVILDPTDHTAFVGIVGIVDGPDVVVKFSTETFAEIDRVAVGQDPHLSLARQNNLLYVPCQGTDELFVLDRDTLEVVTVLSIPAAHGTGMAKDGETFYTTNIAGGGIEGLWAIDTGTNTVIGVTDTPFPTPHNIALRPNGRKIYVTHSGATANQVTVYTVSKHNPSPVFLTAVTVGLNPFGLAYVP